VTALVSSNTFSLAFEILAVPELSVCGTYILTSYTMRGWFVVHLNIERAVS
jgi:hypothetical protein